MAESARLLPESDEAGEREHEERTKKGKPT
jgi:hypothetical protein